MIFVVHQLFVFIQFLCLFLPFRIESLIKSDEYIKHSMRNKLYQFQEKKNYNIRNDCEEELFFPSYIFNHNLPHTTNKHGTTRVEVKC